MEQHSYRTKIFSAILSVLMATQVFPFAVLADSVMSTTDSNSIEAFTDYEPEIVYDDDVRTFPELPPDITYLSESDYEYVKLFESDESEEFESPDSETDSSTDTEGEADFNAQPLIRNNKNLTSDSEESIHTLGGALEYSNTDYILKGVNGLDLVIGRRYNSSSSYDYTVKNDYLPPDVAEIDLIPETFEETTYDIGKGWIFAFPSIRLTDPNEEIHEYDKI